jgi:hypothetical protein
VNDVYEISKNEDGLGGLAELCTIIKQQKEEKNCLVTLNGDFLSASLLAAKFKGSHIIDILNTIPSLKKIFLTQKSHTLVWVTTSLILGQMFF